MKIRTGTLLRYYHFFNSVGYLAWICWDT